MDGLTFGDVDCFLGSGNGLLKALSFSKKQFVNLNQLQLANYDVKEVVDICAIGEQSQLFVAHETGVVQAYNVESETGLSASYNADFRLYMRPCADGGEQAVLDGDATDNVLRNIAVYDGRLIACWKDGELVTMPLSATARSKVGKKKKKKAQAKRQGDGDGEGDGDEETAPRLLANVGRDVERMRQNGQARRFVALGGRENELKVYDLASQRADVPLFAARNVAHDWLNVRVPVFIKDVAFMDERNRLATASAHRRVRLYDPTSPQRRPVAELTFGDDVLTTIASRPDRMQVVVGNGKGRLGLIDFRQPARLVRCYKGFAGSVRTVQLDEARGRVIAAGLDRFVMAHNVDSGLVEQRVFVKSQVNCLLLNPTFRTSRHPTQSESCTATRTSNKTETETENDVDSFSKLLDESDSESESESADEADEAANDGEQDSSENEDEFETGMRLAPLKRTAKRSRDEFVKPSRRKVASSRPQQTILHHAAKSSKKRRAAK